MRFLSSNFCIIIGLCVTLGAGAGAAAAAAPRLTDVVKLPGSEFASFDGVAIDQLALLACGGTECHPIPFQVDERDAAGHWALDHGPFPATDDPPGVLDANDLLLFMADDAGTRAAPGALSQASGQGVSGMPAEITLRDPVDGATHWAYLVAVAGQAPRAAGAYVTYDPVTDRVHGRRVSLGFAGGVPGFLAVGDEVNLLDRLKVRAAATFLFGLIHFTRSEGDLRTEFIGWHDGPIRVVRAQRQWVRLGWGIRSPTFGSYTYFYRDCAELPVGLSLNFKPTRFFGNILVQVILDFRDLRGWSLLVPSVPGALPIDGTMSGQKEALGTLSDTWFALRGPQITLVQRMDLSPSLATVRHRLLYRETQRREPPEAVAGEQPGIGYQLDQWEGVGAGAHQLASVSYAVPAEIDVVEFMRVHGVPLEVSVRPVARD